MRSGSSKALQIVSGLCFTGSFGCWLWAAVPILGIIPDRPFIELAVVVWTGMVLCLSGFATLITGSKWIRDALIHWLVERMRHSVLPIGLSDEDFDEMDSLSPTRVRDRSKPDS